MDETAQPCPKCNTPVPPALPSCPRCGLSGARFASLRTDQVPTVAPAASTRRPSVVSRGSQSSTVVGVSHSLPPELSDRYEIVSCLGTGGMAVVFLARDLRLEREVALKCIKMPSVELATRFEQEARLLAALEHPNVVRVYDILLSGDSPYLVMEYVRGKTLSIKLAEGRPPPIETVRIMPANTSHGGVSISRASSGQASRPPPTSPPLTRIESGQSITIDVSGCA